MKKLLSVITAVAMLMCVASAENTNTSNGSTDANSSATQRAEGDFPQGNPPQMPDGNFPQGDPSQMSGDFPQGNPPQMPDGNSPQGDPSQMPGDFSQGNPPQMPGGMSAAPSEYASVENYDTDTVLTDTDIASVGTDENALLVTGGNVEVNGGTVTRESKDSTGGDNSSFYGVGAAALVTDGTLTVNGACITTDAAGGAGVFAYGSGTAYVSDCVITTTQGTSGGIHVAGGGTLYANDLTVETNGASSAAIRSDRGGGTMVVNGGSYTSNGSGSPAVYVTADITVSDADLIATGSEALCLEGRNNVVLNNCSLSGNMPDLEQNDNTWTVILYQSMSGDSEIGVGSFTMNGGSLTSGNGGMFYTTNTESVFTLENVELIPCADSEYLLRCTGNANQRGWGTSGNNGAVCIFNAIDQTMTGTVIWDTVSQLTLNLTGNTVYTGAVIDDESCAGTGGEGGCTVNIDATSTWVVTGDCTVTELNNEGTITDEQGRTVTVRTADGQTVTEGDSEYTITVA